MTQSPPESRPTYRPLHSLWRNASRGLTHMSWTDTAAVSIALVACVFDLYSRRIPNALTFGAAAVALVVAAALGGASGAWSSLRGLGVGLAVWFPIYALGGMGAGDVKLMAAIGAWLGAAVAFHAAMFARM